MTTYLQPQDRASDLRKSFVEPVTGAETDGSGADPPLAVIPTVCLLQCLTPSLCQFRRHTLAVSNLHEEVAVRISRFEVKFW